MQVWNVLHAARWKYRTQKVVKNRHLGTIAQLCRAISSQQRINNRKKLVKQQYQYGELWPTNGSDLSGSPANFNGFHVLAALLHGTLVVGVSQTAALNRGCHLAHISSCYYYSADSFYHPTEGGRLSRARHCRQSLKPLQRWCQQLAYSQPLSCEAYY